MQAPINRGMSRGFHRRIAKLAATTLAAAAFAALAGPATSLAAPGVPGAPAPAVTCNQVAAPGGSDSAPGTAAQPFSSVAKLAASLQSGKTGCLRSGSYGSSSTSLRLTTPQITLSSYPGETATVVGIVRVEATASGTTLANLILDGRNSTNDLSPLVYASNVVVRNNEITNHNTAICLHLDRYPGAAVPTDVLVEGNRIHNCGALPANNFDHGIYLGKAERAVVRGNWIYDNANRGIQLYSQAHHTLVTGNVIDGNGEGVAFGGEQENPSSDNVVENNVISNSVLRDNVESWWGGPVGTNNRVRQNCVGGGAYDDGEGGVLSGANLGFTTSANVIAQPQFVNRAANDFTIVAGSACAGVLSGSPAGPADDGADHVTLTAGRNQLEAGQRLTLEGSSRGAKAVTLMIRRTGAWHRLRTVIVHGSKGRYRTDVRIHRAGRARFKATATGLRDSKRVKVKVRRDRGRN
jgi:parallel beta-helix repeat protein